MNQTLEEKLTAADALAADWKQKVGLIENGIAAAQRVVDASEGRRAEFALGAATGSASDSSALKRIYSEDQAAQRQLQDLKLALAPARRELAVAEQAASEIRRALAKERSVELARQRIAVAERADRAAADYEAAMKEFNALGAELHESKLNEFFERGYGLGNTVSAMESLAGLERVKNSLPPFVRKMFNTVYFGSYVRLADAEAAFWQLPPVKKSDAA